jgi:hypothetical protein
MNNWSDEETDDPLYADRRPGPRVSGWLGVKAQDFDPRQGVSQNG